MELSKDSEGESMVLFSCFTFLDKMVCQDVRCREEYLAHSNLAFDPLIRFIWLAWRMRS